MRRLATVLAACLAPAASCALAADELGGGLHYSTGDYGAGADTEITSLVFTAQRETGPWRFKVSVPYLEVTGPGTVIPGVGNVNTNPRRRGGGAASGTASGLGDIVGSATYGFLSGRDFSLDGTARVKLPTADENEGLGTGETDIGFQVDAYQTFDRLTPFVGIGYTIFGSSSFVSIDDAMNYTLGATYRLNARDSVGLSLDGRERLSAASAEQRELVGYWTRRLGGPWRTQAYFLVGMADGSPDWGLGATALYAF
jgi:hypothetical protein